MIELRFATHNLHGPDKNQDRRHKTIVAFLNKAIDLGGFQELNPRDRAFLKSEAAKRGLSVYYYGTNGLVWNPKTVIKNKITPKRIMKGGYVGADGVATPQKGDDDRRVGPDRHCIYGDFSPVENPDFDFEFDDIHTMARTFTLHRWRLRLFVKSIAAASAGIRRGDGVMVGDFNDPNYRNLPGIADRTVPTPPTMGSRRYDQIREWGQCRVRHSSVKVQITFSDHKMVYGVLTLPEAAIPAPPPVLQILPRPGQSRINWPRYGAPVRHPWAKRPTRWMKRNRKTWLAILRWRKAYLIKLGKQR